MQTLILGLTLIAAPPGMGGERPAMHKHGGPTLRLPALFQRAEAVAGEDAEKVIQMKQAYIPRWIRQEAEVAVARFELHQALKNPQTTPSDLKKALQKLRSEQDKLWEIRDQAILDLRNLLGERFPDLFRKPERPKRPEPPRRP